MTSPTPAEPYDLDFAPSSIPATYLEAIGLMAVSWTSLEDAVEQAIAGLAGLDIRRGAAMITHATFPLRLEQLTTLASLIFPNEGPAT